MKFLQNIFIIVILLQIIKTVPLNEEATEGYCIDDSYCNPPYTTCNLETNYCKHKDLFP